MPKENLTEENRLNLRKFFFSAIHDLSNFEKQSRVWLNPAGRPWDNYEEFVLSFWDGDYDFSGKFDFLSEAEHEAIWPLILALEEYKPPSVWQDQYDDAVILSDPAWRQVVSAAAEAAIAVEPLLLDADEIRHLINGYEKTTNPDGSETRK